MTARPIMMNARSVQNLLAGRKTQTRRLVKPQPNAVHRLALRGGFASIMTNLLFSSPDQWVKCPHGQPGDLLWVRERFSLVEPIKSSSRDDPHWTVGVEYSDGYEKQHVRFDEKPKHTRARGEHGWRPSIFMPRWMSRLTLHVTDVNVQRLNEINDADCIAEGVDLDAFKLRGDTAIVCYRRIWEEIRGSFSWGDNPFVWVLTFEVLRENVDHVLRSRSVA